MKKAIIVFTLAALGAQAQQAVRFTGQPGEIPVSVAATSVPYTGITSLPTLTVPCNITGGTADATACTAALLNTGLGVVLGAGNIPATQYLLPVGSGAAGTLGISTLKLNGGILYPTTDSTTAVQINKADGTTNVVTVDTTNGYIGIGGTPTQKLHVLGSGATVAIDSTGFTSGRKWQLQSWTDGNFYLNNNTTAIQIAYGATNNFSIGAGASDSNYKFDITSSGSAGTLRVYDRTASTGLTKVLELAGAGQSTNPIHTISYPGLGATTSPGLLLTNTTAAAAGAQQWSPANYQCGQGWKTTATAASQEVCFRSYVTPVQGAAAPTANWTLDSSINGGAFGNGLTYSSAGALSPTIDNSQNLGSGSFRFGAGYIVTLSSFSAVFSNAVTSGRYQGATDGMLLLSNGAGNDFARLQFGGTTSSFPALKRSTATLQARLADDSAYAGFTALYVATPAVAVANLPATPVDGQRAGVTDSNAVSCAAGVGTTVASGGTTHCPVYYDGTNWIIF